MKKPHYKVSLHSILVLLLLFVFAACKQTSGVKDQNGCKYLVNFKNDEWSGKIINKYIDQTLNNTGVISIENDNGILKISDVFLSDSTNYERIKVGDSIVKIKNELLVYLYNSSGVTKIKTDFDCDSFVVKDEDFLYDIMDGWLKLGLNQSEVLHKLGPPDEKSTEDFWGAIGTYVEKWNYNSKGITLQMDSENKGGNKKVLMITVSKSNKMKTVKMVGINSNRDLIIEKYGAAINDGYSSKKEIVVGSIYGGIIFELEDDKVKTIFIGAKAE